jgi:transposase
MIHTYHGFDVSQTLKYDVIDKDGAQQKRIVTIEARAVRVHSSALLRTKMATGSRLAERESKKAQKLIRDWQDCVYACVADAQRAADRHIAQTHFATIDLHSETVHHDGPAKKGRGRPRKRPEPALAGKEHWRVRYSTIPVPENVTAQRLHDQATFVIVRTRNPKWIISDEEMILRYQGQYKVEHGFAWLKSGAPIDPIYLHTEHRIASLCFIYCLGLIIWNMIQRTVRAYLKSTEQGLPYHRNVPSDNITTRFLFELFPKVQTVPVSIGGKYQHRLAGMEHWQKLACKALGTRVSEFERPAG